MKKLSLALLTTMMFTGCSTIDPVLVETVFPNPNTYGYNPGDPCIRCGESFIFIPNEEFGAIKQRQAQIEAQKQAETDPQ
jgi:PBP1b-binding outer membrane lipoprotein LpoB